VLATKMPVWAPARRRRRSTGSLRSAETKPIDCGGCAIFPGDLIVADDDVPLWSEGADRFVVAEGEEHERYETWVVSEVSSAAVKYRPLSAQREAKKH